MQTLPFAFALMSGKTRELYDAVLEKILTVARLYYPVVEYPVLRMISDFEAAILGAMASAFPSGQSRGCWFHYGQV